MEAYGVVLAGFGALVLLTAWLPMVLRVLPLSLPICCVGIGAILALIPTVAGLSLQPSEHLGLIEHATGGVVIISLTGAGLKIDRLIGWCRWRQLGRGSATGREP